MTLTLHTTYDRDQNDIAQTTLAPSLTQDWLPVLTLKRSGRFFEPRETIVAYILRP